MGIRGLAFLMVLMAVVLALPRRALADQPGAHTVPVAVLAFDSEDAEDQAEAITGAIRSRLRAAQGWSLIETTQSLGMLTAAMKCPTRPPPECQQKIAEQIKAERYIFGFVSKGPQQGQVTAEIHLYQRGKADTILKEQYADNLKDPNDDGLRKIAARIVERLGGTAVGIVVVHAPDLSGDVIIDGEKHVPLDKGNARIELAAGGHAVEVTASTGGPIKRNVLVTAGRETVVEFTAAPVNDAPPEMSRASSRKLIGGVAMGVGVVLGAIAVYELVHYFSLQSDGDTAAKKAPMGQPCRETLSECAAIDSSSKTASGLAIGLGAGAAAAIGVGAYLFFTGTSNEKTGSADPPKPTTRLVPTVSSSSGGLTVLGSF